MSLTDFTGEPAEDVGYPSGSRLKARYETIPGGMAVRGFRQTMTMNALTFAAAAELQTRLPEGFALGRGRISHVLGKLPPRSSPDDMLQPQAAAPAQGKFVSLHPLEYQDVPLAKGSDYLAIFSEDRRLLATRQRGLPTTVDAVEPTIMAETAAEVALMEVANGISERPFQVAETALEIWVTGEQEGRLAWRVVLDTDDLGDPKGRQYWISAVEEAKVLHWETTIFHNHFGTALGNLWSTSPLQNIENRPLGGLRVARSGASGGAVITAADGRYGFVGGSGNATLDATLAGPRAAITNMAGAVMSVSNSGTPSSAVDLNFGASTEFELAQVTAYYWTNFARQLSEAGLAADPTHQMPVRVNLDSSCNAFYRLSDRSINFFRAGGSCPNTAYSDVVLHEWGHYVDHVNGGILDGGLSEGIGDALAILGTRQSCLGRDFLGAGTCLRQAADLILWPPAPGEGVHAQGRRYAGFVWELVQQLQIRYGVNGAFDIATQLIVATIVANPSSIPDAVHLAFLLDDDDGDLSNGTPHFKELAAAADSRNLPRPADPVAASGITVGSAHFPWTPVKTASSNSNLLEVTIRLNQPSDVHILAGSSARTSSVPRAFRTGFFNQPNPNVMWTDSLREITLNTANEWVNFSSQLSIALPAGEHTIYWKLWVSGAEIQFSSGSLLVEAFGTPRMSFAAAEPLAETEDVTGNARSAPLLDPNDPSITTLGSN